MNNSRIISGTGPSKSSVTYTSGPYPVPTYTLAFDNYGIEVSSGATSYSWIFVGPDEAKTLSIILRPESGFTGSVTCQLYGGFTHDVNSNPTTDAGNWTALGTSVNITSVTPTSLVASEANIYPAYCIQVVGGSATSGIIDWVCAGAS